MYCKEGDHVKKMYDKNGIRVFTTGIPMTPFESQFDEFSLDFTNINKARIDIVKLTKINVRDNEDIIFVKRHHLESKTMTFENVRCCGVIIDAVNNPKYGDYTYHLAEAMIECYATINHVRLTSNFSDIYDRIRRVVDLTIYEPFNETLYNAVQNAVYDKVTNIGLATRRYTMSNETHNVFFMFREMHDDITRSREKER